MRWRGVPRDPVLSWLAARRGPRCRAAARLPIEASRVATFGGNIIETGTDSYRLAHTKNKQAVTTASLPVAISGHPATTLTRRAALPLRSAD